MGDMGDMWRAVKNAAQIDKGQRLLQAGSEFAQAKALADNAGLVLRQCSDVHYQLSALDRSWHVNLYPSTFRIIVVNRKSAPRIALGYNEEWTLLGIIQKLLIED